MNQEQVDYKQRLEQELSELHFSRQAKVLKRTHPKSWRNRMQALWDREIELSLVPVSMAFILILLSAYVVHTFQSPLGLSRSINRVQHTDSREMIDFVGNKYWKDEVERRISEHENKDQS